MKTRVRFPAALAALAVVAGLFAPTVASTIVSVATAPPVSAAINTPATAGFRPQNATGTRSVVDLTDITSTHTCGGVSGLHYNTWYGWNGNGGSAPGLDGGLGVTNGAYIEGHVSGWSQSTTFAVPPASFDQYDQQSGTTSSRVGVSWYRDHLCLTNIPVASEAYLEFDAAPGVSDVYVGPDGVNAALTQFKPSTTMAQHGDSHVGGYSRFRFDITSTLGAAGTNEVIAVSTDNTLHGTYAPNSTSFADFADPGGLYRNARIVWVDNAHLAMNDAFDFTCPTSIPNETGCPETNGTDTWTGAHFPTGGDGIFVKPVLTNPSTGAATLDVSAQIENDRTSGTVKLTASLISSDGSGAVVPGVTSTATIAGGASGVLSTPQMSIPKVNEWFPRTGCVDATGCVDPNAFCPNDAGGNNSCVYWLDVAITQHVGGVDVLRDEVWRPVAFRTIVVHTGAGSPGCGTGQTGLCVNGRLWQVRGVAWHQGGYNQVVTTCCDPTTQDGNDVALMEKMGVNAVRVVHYEHAPSTLDTNGTYVDGPYDLLDQAGILATAEVPNIGQVPSSDPSPPDGTTNYDKNVEQQLVEMARQVGWHPSVFAWGVANETSPCTTGTTRDPQVLLRELTALDHALDPASGTTANHFGFIASSWENKAQLSGGAGANDPRVNPSVQPGATLPTTATDLTGYNRYLGWYTNDTGDFTNTGSCPGSKVSHTGPPIVGTTLPSDDTTLAYTLYEYHIGHGTINYTNANQAVGLTEYGAGGSQWVHEDPPPYGTAIASGSTATIDDHTSDQQAAFHEQTWPVIDAINGNSKAWCWDTTAPHANDCQATGSGDSVWGSFIWNMFDFATPNKNEGVYSEQNDKGLVTDDRATEKDAYYYYAANWTTPGDTLPDGTTQPYTVHLNDHGALRPVNASTDIHGYSNYDYVRLSKNAAGDCSGTFSIVSDHKKVENYRTFDFTQNLSAGTVCYRVTGLTGCPGACVASSDYDQTSWVIGAPPVDGTHTVTIDVGCTTTCHPSTDLADTDLLGGGYAIPCAESGCGTGANTGVQMRDVNGTLFTLNSDADKEMRSYRSLLGLAYVFPVVADSSTTYQVTAKVMEPSLTTTGARLWDIAVNGKTETPSTCSQTGASSPVDSYAGKWGTTTENPNGAALDRETDIVCTVNVKQTDSHGVGYVAVAFEGENNPAVVSAVKIACSGTCP